MELTYKVQTYEWGKRGKNSQVAIFSSNVNPLYNIDENLPYAELWIGTHISGPSLIKSTTESLDFFIEQNPEYLGQQIIDNFGKQLPFLLKVLSINKALSIQAHPSKSLAEQLHSKFPDIYKDDNHKPELAIALTPFEAFCGFRPLNEINFFIQNIPEFREVCGVRWSSTFDIKSLKNAFKSVLKCSKDTITNQLMKMLERFQKLNKRDRQTQLADLIERLYKQYPNDVGCFIVYFLNFIQLKPLEAIYLKANEPHAYIFGDCVECMACSDNVVRAGLTPKFIDVDTLCSMLTYESKTTEQLLLHPIIEDENCKIFKPSVPDFAVVQIMVENKKSYEMVPRNCGSTLIVISGKAKIKNIQLKAGTALFIPSNESLKITDINNSLLMYQAILNL